MKIKPVLVSLMPPVLLYIGLNLGSYAMTTYLLNMYVSNGIRPAMALYLQQGKAELGCSQNKLYEFGCIVTAQGTEFAYNSFRGKHDLKAILL